MNHIDLIFNFANRTKPTKTALNKLKTTSNNIKPMNPPPQFFSLDVGFLTDDPLWIYLLTWRP